MQQVLSQRSFLNKIKQQKTIRLPILQSIEALKTIAPLSGDEGEQRQLLVGGTGLEPATSSV
jgi:hypothetical protein